LSKKKSLCLDQGCQNGSKASFAGRSGVSILGEILADTIEKTFVKAFNSLWSASGPMAVTSQVPQRGLWVLAYLAKKCGDCVGKIVQNLLKCGKSDKMWKIRIQ